MAANGKTIILKPAQIKRLQGISDKDNIREYLKGKGLEHQTLYRVFMTGRVSEKVYKRLTAANLV